MSVRFKELDRRRTAMGEISQRRRLEPTLQVDVYEVKLGDEFLMSSLFTATEVALAELGLAELARHGPRRRGRWARARARVHGVFALWSDDPPDNDFLAAVEQVFASCEARVVTFPNPHTGGEGSSTVYVATLV